MAFPLPALVGLGAAGAALVAWLARRGGDGHQGHQEAPGGRLAPSTADLHPDVRFRVERTVARLQRDGWTPLVFEVRRHKDRGTALASAGFSQLGAASRHVADAGQVRAADVVDGRTLHGRLVLWGDTDPAWGLTEAQAADRRAAAAAFFAALGPVAESEGLTWGGRWTSPYDPAHLQG